MGENSFLRHVCPAELQGTEHKPYYDLLQLFAYGTYKEYKQRAGEFPEVSAPQLQKLKMMTLVSLASGAKVLPYASLMAELDLPTIRELEDLVIDCTYEKLLAAKLNQKNACVEVEFACARDISQADVASMIQQLTAWNTRADQVVQKLQAKIEAANGKHAAKLAMAAAHEKEFDARVAAFKVDDPQARDGGTSNQFPRKCLDYTLSFFEVWC